MHAGTGPAPNRDRARGRPTTATGSQDVCTPAKAVVSANTGSPAGQFSEVEADPAS